MAAPGVATPCSRVELSIRCKNLLDKDVTSKSDPCVVVFLQDKGRWFEIGRTENIKNCLNPEFTRTFEVDYYFEEVQRLMFAAYDIDNKTPQLNDDDFLGQLECTMGQIVSGNPFSGALMLRNGKPAGKGVLMVYAEELSGLNDVYNLHFSAKKLDKKDFMGKSDPYLEFSREMKDGTWQVIHRTEVIKNNLNPEWRMFSIKAQKLCAGDINRVIKVGCYDYDNNDEHDLIGSFNTSVSQLQQTIDSQIEWPCINPKKQAKKKGYKDSGTVILHSCKITKEYSFLDFIFGGTQVNFTVAIDFTASNGDPRQNTSLHYMHPQYPNEYQKAIQAVGAVIQDYDSDKMFPSLGFGAKIPPDYAVSHEFSLTFVPNNPFCAGIAGIMDAYRNCLSQIQLYGPTNFSPVINHVARFASHAKAQGTAQNYYVLLILTDGAITDIDATLHAIVGASALPMSIIIVGVGQADFTAMNMLDGDDGVLRAPGGHRAQRDIVQFVPFRQFAQASPATLAKHVLAELPKQVTDYYKVQRIVPNPRPAPQQPPPPPAQ